MNIHRCLGVLSLSIFVLAACSNDIPVDKPKEVSTFELPINQRGHTSIQGFADFEHIQSLDGVYEVEGQVVGMRPCSQAYDCPELQHLPKTDIKGEVDVQSLVYILRISFDPSDSSTLDVVLNTDDLNKLNQKLGTAFSGIAKQSQSPSQSQSESVPILVYQDLKLGLEAYFEPRYNQAFYFDKYADARITLTGEYPEFFTAQGSDLYVAKNNGMAQMWLAKEGVSPEMRAKVEKEFVKKESVVGKDNKLPSKYLAMLTQKMAEYQQTHLDKPLGSGQLNLHTKYRFTLNMLSFEDEESLDHVLPGQWISQKVFWHLLDIEEIDSNKKEV